VPREYTVLDPFLIVPDSDRAVLVRPLQLALVGQEDLRTVFYWAELRLQDGSRYAALFVSIHKSCLLAHSAYATQKNVLGGIHDKVGVCDRIPAERNIHGVNKTKVGYSTMILILDD